MIPVCCICGKSAKTWCDNGWKCQEFCPDHYELITKDYNDRFIRYLWMEKIGEVK